VTSISKFNEVKQVVFGINLERLVDHESCLTENYYNKNTI
jgi:hypothetical protein